MGRDGQSRGATFSEERAPTGRCTMNLTTPGHRHGPPPEPVARPGVGSKRNWGSEVSRTGFPPDPDFPPGRPRGTQAPAVGSRLAPPRGRPRAASKAFASARMSYDRLATLLARRHRLSRKAGTSLDVQQPPRLRHPRPTGQTPVTPIGEASQFRQPPGKHQESRARSEAKQKSLVRLHR